MIELSQKWTAVLSAKPETGMGFQVVSVVLKDGRRFDQAIVVEGRLTQIRGHDTIPFVEDQIAEVIVTHDKWDFGRENRRRE